MSRSVVDGERRAVVGFGRRVRPGAGVWRALLAHVRRGHLRQDGTTVVEFALIAPLLFVVLFGVMEGGWLMATYVTLENGAREGTRAGRFTSRSDADIRAAVRSIPGVVGSLSDGKIVVTPPTARVSGDSVTVTVNYTHDMLPLVGSLLGGPRLAIRAQSTGSVE